jgi:hypothetical protein
LQLANAKADAQFWDGLADMHAGTVEGHAGLTAGAERTNAGAAVEHARAAEQGARAKDRIARIERGEDVAGGLGKPLTLGDWRGRHDQGRHRALHASGGGQPDIRL